MMKMNRQQSATRQQEKDGIRRWKDDAFNGWKYKHFIWIKTYCVLWEVRVISTFKIYKLNNINCWKSILQVNFTDLFELMDCAKFKITNLKNNLINYWILFQFMYLIKI